MVCLYCPAAYNQTQDLLHHMTVVHGFDFVALRKELNLNFYQQVKLINYIRRMVHLGCCTGCTQRFPTQEALVEHLAWAGHHRPTDLTDWDQPQYYFPTYENDNLLFGLEDEDKDTEDSGFTSDSSASFPPVLPEDFPQPVQASILQDDEVRRSLIPFRRNKSRTRRF